MEENKLIHNCASPEVKTKMRNKRQREVKGLILAHYQKMFSDNHGQPSNSEFSKLWQLITRKFKAEADVCHSGIRLEDSSHQ